MADLESTLHYSLRVEAARAAALSGAQLAAFKCYVATLVKVRSFRCRERNCPHLHVAIYKVKCKCRARATTSQRSQVAKHGGLGCEPCVLMLSVAHGRRGAVPIPMDLQTQPGVPTGAGEF